MDENEENREISRRRILKSAAAGMATMGISGTVAAELDSQGDEIVEPYRDIEVIRQVVAERPKVLEVIYELGLIEEPSVEALGVMSLGEQEFRNGSTVEVMPREVWSGLTPDIRIEKTYHSTEEGEIRPGPDPERNRRARLLISIKPENESYFVDWSPVDPGYTCPIDPFRTPGIIIDKLPWDIGKDDEDGGSQGFCDYKCRTREDKTCNGQKDMEKVREKCPPPPPNEFDPYGPY